MGDTAMTETAKEGARRLAGFMLAKGYQPEALHEYTDENGRPCTCAYVSNIPLLARSGYVP